MQIRFAKRFAKQYDKSPRNIQKSVDSRINLFIQDPLNPTLRNHLLSGKYSGQRSINITGDWRAIYSEERGTVTFHLLGTHSQLYKS